MSHWMQCPFCWKWCVSAACLADLRDKTCPYCSNQLDEVPNSENESAKEGE